MKKSLFLCCALWMLAAYAGPEQFLSKPMSAGKASLAENAYSISRLLDTANFSPELKLPVQLVYNSSVEKSGLFGFAWRSPQLESTAYYDKDGVLWVTPWGEKIKFFSNPNSTVTSATGKITIPLGWLDLPPFIGIYALTGSHWVKK